MTNCWVTCVLPTFARPIRYQHLIEEAIESFIRQDYDNCDLIVLNDAPQQALTCDAPGVRIVNADQRFPSVGDKFNALIAMACGELICPWDDDDISLPNRVSQGVQCIGEYDYWTPGTFWYKPINHAPICVKPNAYCHENSIFRKTAWEKVGRYPSLSGPYDCVMQGKLRANCREAPHVEMPPADWSYIYRWGVSPCHISAFADPEAKYLEIGEWPIDEGTFVLHPHWEQDYVKACLDALS